MALWCVATALSLATPMMGSAAAAADVTLVRLMSEEIRRDGGRYVCRVFWQINFCILMSSCCLSSCCAWRKHEVLKSTRACLYAAVCPCHSCQLNALKGYNNKITRLLADRKVMEFIKAFPTIFHCSTQDIRGEVHTASLCENWRPELLQLEQQSASQARPSTPQEETVVKEAPPAAAVHLCSVCQCAFSSRNRLFQHVKLMRADDAGHLSCVEAEGSGEAQSVGARSGGPLGQRERQRERDEAEAERRRERVLEDECVRALRRRACKESNRHTVSKAPPTRCATVPFVGLLLFRIGDRRLAAEGRGAGGAVTCAGGGVPFSDSDAARWRESMVYHAAQQQQCTELTNDHAYLVWLCTQPQVKRALHLLLRGTIDCVHLLQNVFSYYENRLASAGHVFAQALCQLGFIYAGKVCVYIYTMQRGTDFLRFLAAAPLDDDDSAQGGVGRPVAFSGEA